MDFKFEGVCARGCTMQVEDNVIKEIEVHGGCDGNRKGLVSLLVGMNVQEAYDKLNGITCRERPTSCPDQIAKSLKTML